MCLTPEIESLWKKALSVTALGAIGRKNEQLLLPSFPPSPDRKGRKHTAASQQSDKAQGSLSS